MINNSTLRPVFERINLLFCHWPDRLYTAHPGTEEQTVFVIRPLTDTQGLLSSYLHVLKNIIWANNNGYVPYVDFESPRCQYYTGRVIHDSKNAWEYYFEQPSDLTKGRIAQFKNVIYSGWSLSKRKNPKSIPKRPEIIEDKGIMDASRMCPVKQYIKEIVDKKYRELFLGKTVLGVFIRGTDYVKLRPKGHAQQPDIESVVSKIQDFLNQYPIEKIFVVTEDLDYYHILQNQFGEMVFSSDNYFISNYNGNQYVGAAFKNDSYERGLNYLIRILLYGLCDYSIAGITNGSVVANILREKEPQESYWFDLGVY